MIRHGIALNDLLGRIDALVPTWRTRAGTRTTAAIQAGRVGDTDGIWSEIKAIYMELQGFKCMYCEKPMPAPSPQGTAEGKVEYDVEHFRPKNRVTRWPTSEVKTKRRIDYDAQLQQGEAVGYVRLAFQPWNYGVSCKTCNSELKGDRFPILGAINAALTDRTALDAAELPCLVLPIGDGGVDPEAWLEWKGPVVSAKATLDAQTRLRARTLIDFFELDSRSDLVLQRCHLIFMLAAKLEQAQQPAPAGPKARDFIDRLTDRTGAFAGCGRGFVALFNANPTEAKRWRDLAEEYILSKDPTILQ
jgi:hypothetical protein